MPRKASTIINVPEMDMAKIKEIVQNDNAPYQEIIGAIYEIKDICDFFKTLKENLEEKVKSTPLPEIIKTFVDAGLCAEGETPVINVGTKYSVKLSEAIQTNFDVNTKKLLEMGALVPEKYKKVTTTINKAAIEADFDKDDLDPLLKPYVSTDPVTITKTSVSTIKPKEESDKT